MKDSFQPIDHKSTFVLYICYLSDTYEPKLWTGGHDNTVSRRFEWVANSEVFSYSYWNEREPNNKEEHCVMMFSSALLWNDGPCSTPLGFVCEANPLINEKSAELATLKASFDNQTELLAKKMEELGALKQQLGMVKKDIELETSLRFEIDDLKNIYRKGFEELKLKLTERDLQQQSIKENEMVLKDLYAELKTIKNSKTILTNQSVPLQISTETDEVPEPLENYPVENEYNPSAISPSVPEALLKAKTMELEDLKKTNDKLLNQLFAVLMKSYENDTNRNASNKPVILLQQLNKN